MGWKYTREVLEEAVAASVSFAGVVRFLGLVETGGNHTHISRSIRRMGIDTSHFTGQAWARGTVSPRRSRPEQILVLRDPGTPRVNGEKLRACLLAIGRTYMCAVCGNEGRWCGQPITLHVDHINGDYFDNRPENLRFMCPNCHAATPTFAGKNRLRMSE